MELRQIIRLVARLVLITATAPLSLMAQTDQSVDFTPPLAIYAGSNIDNVSLPIGNLHVAIPLVHLKGRGLDFEINASYNSKQWQTTEFDDPSGYVLMTSSPVADAGGWSIGIPQMGVIGEYISQCTFINVNGCSQALFSAQFLTTEGSLMALADSAGPTTQIQPVPGHRYWATNGSYMVIPTASLLSNGQFAQFVVPKLIYNNGISLNQHYNSQYFNDYSTLEDTNGNFISCTWDTASGMPYPGVPLTCTDTVGRTITFGHQFPDTGHEVISSISYLDSAGQTQTINFTWQEFGLDFPWANDADHPEWQDCQPANTFCWVIQADPMPLLTKITLPNGLAYSFQYVSAGGSATTGEMAQILLPTGGYTRYVYECDPGLCTGAQPPNFTAPASTRKVFQRIVSSDGTAASEQTWTYGYAIASDPSFGWEYSVTDPTGDFQGSWFGSCLSGQSCVPTNVAGCIPGPTRVDYKNPSGTLLKQVFNVGGVDRSTYDINPTAGCSNPRILSTRTVLSDTHQQSLTTYSYGTFGNPSDEYVYDWGPGAPGVLLRHTNYQYLHDINGTAYGDTGAHIVDRIISRVIYDDASNIVAKSTIGYDSTAPLDTSSVVQHDYSAFSAANSVRGNPTQSSRWLSTNNSWLTTTNIYNDVGNMLQTTDPGNNITTYSYTDNYANGTPAQSTSAFVTLITRPMTNGVDHKERFQYYFSTGLTAARCGENFPSGSACVAGLTGQPDYEWFTYDLLGRPLTITSGDAEQTTYTYNESALPINITTSTKIDSTHSLTQTTVYDRLGRPSQMQLTSDPAGTVYQLITYDSVGRKSRVYNATRCNPPDTNCGEATWGYTTFAYDGLGRITTVTAQDGGSTTSSFNGNAVTIADPAGKQRRNVTDALARLIEVDESGIGLPTLYFYDALGNLTCVEQHGDAATGTGCSAAPSNDATSPFRVRRFTYDTLSRLVSSSNPESNTALVSGTPTRVNTTYSYDPNGNLLQKALPAPNQTGTATQTISFCYDALNRVTGKAYVAQNCPLTSPVASFSYDQTSFNGLTIVYGIGRRTGTTDQAGWASYSYDLLGRLSSETRVIGAISKTVSYEYNVDGSLKTLHYPSERAVTYTPDSAGRQIAAADSNGTNYVSSASYNAPGSLTGLVNGGALTSSFLYNSRLQLCRISAFTSGSAAPSCGDPAVHGNLMDRGYNFNLGSGDNGNVISITNYRDTSRSQSFTYDALNRITSGSSAANTGPLSWGENYTLDAWGNLQMNPMQGKDHGGYFPNASDVNNRPLGLGYDAAGNLTGYTSSGQYVYDAENRIQAAGGMTYAYDADGNRVEKSGGSTGTLYWYGSPGIIAESDLMGTLSSEYVFFGDKRIARIDLPDNSVHYYLSDHLNSTSMVVSATGVPEEESDYSPFGTEYPVSGTGANHYKFTGKERDSESELDLMGRRYYSNALGRFVQPDPFIPFNLKKEKFKEWISNPQHWNKYTYALNNPLLYVDPSGLTETIYYFVNQSLTEDQKKFFTENKDKILGAIADKLKKAGIKDVVFKDGSTLTKSQIDSIIQNQPKGVAFLTFANKSFADYNAPPGNFGATGDVRSVVFLGNLQKGNPSSSELVFRASEVGSHELGHRMGFYSRGEVMSFIEFWNKDLMNEGQGMPSSPRHFDMSIPQNRQAVDEINMLPEYQPPK